MEDGPRDRKHAFIDAAEDEEGFWTEKGLLLPFASDELPIPQELALRIIDWQHWRTYEPDDVDYWNFSRQGFELARAVKTHLPDWTIEYWDWHKFVESQRLGITDKSYYEYEIMLDPPGGDRA